jgi:uncharacterized protein (DUF58 family)
LIVPTRRLAVAAAILSVAGAVLPLEAPVGLAIAYAVLLVAVIVDWSLAPPPRRVGVRRAIPASLSLGEESSIRWQVGNPSPRALSVSVADELVPSLCAERRRFRVRVPAGGTAEAFTGFRPSRRGEFTMAAVTVRVEGPMGLSGRQSTRRLPDTIRVFPPFRSKREAELRIDRARLLEVGLRSAAARGGGTEFDQLRDYGVDDEFRRIDWAATARSGRPIVKTFRAERNQVVITLLDNGRTMAGRVAGVPRVEHAMDAVMALTAVATRLGDRIGMIAFDRRVRAVLPASQSQTQFGRVVNAMYRLEPELAESDYRGAFTEMMVRFRRRAMVVLLTELADQSLEETLLRDLPLVVRNHLVVVGAVRDPEVQRWAGTDPSDAGSAYLKAAAVSAIADRRRLAATLTSMGATVVDALPGELAPKLSDAYLKVKATGRL